MAIRLPRQATRALDLESLLAALEATIPLCAALFDTEGRLLWLSRAAAARFDLLTSRLNESLVATGNLRALDALREEARPAGLTPNATHGEVPLKEGEVLHTRACSTSTSSDPLVLVYIEPENQPVLMTKYEVISLGLPPRVAESAILAARGYSNAEIANTMGVSPATSATYLKRAFRKLGVHSRAELAFFLVSRSKRPNIDD